MAIAYRNSLFTVTVVVLAAVFLFAGFAHSQEAALPSTGGRSRLVVGLVQSPPCCMRGEDGSWSGISVELWQWIAADLGIDTEFRESTVTGLFDDLAPGRPVDVSIGALCLFGGLAPTPQGAAQPRPSSARGCGSTPGFS
ncbi:MAG TPA: transporter substrate-binding domain-containing protein [Chthoniobacterales bacterium]